MIRYARKVFAVAILVSSALLATEVDSYTNRDPNMNDATIELNNIMHKYIVAAIVEGNFQGFCNESMFRKILQEKAGGALWSKFEDDLEKSLHIDKRTNERSKSIYRDFSISKAPALYLASLGSLMRIGDWYIGTDKFGHFIEEGFNYFNILYGKNGSLESALAFGEKAEREHFGLLTTGVYSYGDLAANYDGLLFWEMLIGHRGYGYPEPYVTCKDGHYQVNRKFDWREFVTPAWDEAENCNGYRTNKMERKVETRIRELESKYGVYLSCPIKPEECQTMIDRYGNAASHIISPKCYL